MASYSKRNGAWSVRFYTIVDGLTKLKRLSGFPTKREAEMAYMQFMATAEKKTSSTSKEIYSLDVLFANYYVFSENRIKESTLYDMKLTSEKHILPYFRKFKDVRKIKKLDVLKWQNELNAKGLSYKYKSKIRTYLVTVWKFAQRYYDIETDPITGVEPFRRTEGKKEMLFWTEDEFKQFICNVDDIIYKTFFSFLYLTGCRKGEALALRWSSINFKQKTARIDKSITRRFNKDKHPNETYLETLPKNIYSIRTIDLPQSLISLLQTYKSTKDFTEDDFVFAGKSPLAPSSLQYAFDKGIAKSSVNRIRIHDLRHSHASILIGKGLDVVSVAKRLGHANIEETLNTYSHFLPQNKDKILKAIDIEL